MKLIKYLEDLFFMISSYYSINKQIKFKIVGFIN